MRRQTGRPTSASCITSVAACAAGATARAAADSTAAAARGVCAKGRATLALLPTAGRLRHALRDQNALPRPKAACALSTSQGRTHLTLLLLLCGSHYPGGPLARCHRPLCGLVQAGACRRHRHHGGGSHGVRAVLVAKRVRPHIIFATLTLARVFQLQSNSCMMHAAAMWWPACTLQAATLG